MWLVASGSPSHVLYMTYSRYWIEPKRFFFWEVKGPVRSPIRLQNGNEPWEPTQPVRGLNPLFCLPSLASLPSYVRNYYAQVLVDRTVVGPGRSVE